MILEPRQLAPPAGADSQGGQGQGGGGGGPGGGHLVLLKYFKPAPAPHLHQVMGVVVMDPQLLTGEQIAGVKEQLITYFR